MPGFELLGKEEKDAIIEFFDKGLFTSPSIIKEFEERFAEYLGVKYAQSVSSGTAAIKVALVAAGVKPGDEVITQAFTFIATVGVIIDIGAVPVIVNVNDTLNMDPVELEKAITPKTKAIIPVHMLGVAAEIDKIIEIAKKYKITIIDDNCQSLGAEWNGKKLGIQSDVCTWSFDSGKGLTTGEGGMVTTNDKEVYLLAREYQDHGHENNPNLPRGRDTRRIPGFNYRISKISAAIGLVQLKKLDFVVETNRNHYKIYEDALKGIKGLNFRRIPDKCNPLCDCLIFSFPEKDQASNFVSMINSKGLVTKNVPDAIEWHFARHWDHIFKRYGISKEELNELTRPSAERLDRSVAIPVMVKMEHAQVERNANMLYDSAREILS